MKIVKLILFTLFGLMFVNAGLDKFFHYMPMPADMPEEMKKVGAAFMEIPWLMPLVGAMELTGGLLAIYPKTRTLGAIVLLPIMVGILAQNFTVAPSGAGIGIAMVLFIIDLWILFDNKQKLNAIFS
ncbi:DoxX family membrane protein [Chryseobacterium sp.]|uniref:DoxX family membrane protein n=1 Tax=Chryseobacterium sp. TaxID=1871047 RepID=UPI0011C7FAE4|nr:DoxX family membrane protein [Chryseobacterium sp.]TXF76174.1 DoxX family membrane protein [Chryseobacterium sp.]